MNNTQKRQTPSGRTGLDIDLQPKPIQLHVHRTQFGDPVQRILDRLEGVQKSGKGWRARCPSCGGKSRKVAISEGTDGRALLHCFSGCGAAEVLDAVGLRLADLYVRRDLRSMSPAERSQMRQAAMIPRWKAALEVLKDEAVVVQIAAAQLADNTPLNDTDSARMSVAASRIFSAWEVLR